MACGIVGRGARDLALRGSVGSGGATGIAGIVGAAWYARGWMWGMVAGVGVTGVAGAGARLLLFARRLRREDVRGGGVEDVDQLAMFFWYAVHGRGWSTTPEKKRVVAGARVALTSCALRCWGRIGLKMRPAGCVRELADGLPQLAVRHGAELEGVERWRLGQARKRRWALVGVSGRRHC